MKKAKPSLGPTDRDNGVYSMMRSFNLSRTSIPMISSLFIIGEIEKGDSFYEKCRNDR
jgi:hypothetical protein